MSGLPKASGFHHESLTGVKKQCYSLKYATRNFMPHTQHPIEILRFNTCGSVDDGKSTLIGRLLYDSKIADGRPA